jgi:PKD repeat protein
MNDLNHTRTLAARLFAAALFLAGVGSASAAARYVDVNSANPTPPYANWFTAATNIQDAVDVAVAGDEVVVTNGTYGPVEVQKALTLRSVSGLRVTTIDGGQSNRCATLGAAANISGFTLTHGVAQNGGGAFGGVIDDCRITGNTATGDGWNRIPGNGGGAFSSILKNCSLIGNSAALGGAADLCTLNNCTLTGNSGGGAYFSTLNNCIVYFNTAQGGVNYDLNSTLNFCCTTPLPANGVGNISLDPQLASLSHLSAVSPCRGAGNASYTTGTDTDGEPWTSPPSIGCDEYHPGVVTGPLVAAISANFTNVSIGFPVRLTALIEGRTTTSFWDFGDGATVTNQPYTSHAWTGIGDYTVVLRAFNESQPGGISAMSTVRVVSGIHYVAAESASPLAPYTSWTTAARNIQDAVYAAVEPGAQVLVTNGTYRPIRLQADGLVPVRSVNGPLYTFIDGARSNQCVFYEGGSASLSGFTLTNGVTDYGGGAIYTILTNCVLTGNSAYNGGGAFGCTLNNCTLNSNSAFSFGGGANGCTLNNCTLTGNSAYWGGGTSSGTLNNCTLSGNSASYIGGGAFGGTLNNCTLTGNSASTSGYGGGASDCTLNNCIAYFNTAALGANYDPNYSTLNYSCTTPLPTNGIGNITNAPLFVDKNGWGNLRLQSNSPCINAGLNPFAPSGPALDGNPRIKGNTVDIGAYEFQSPASVISYAWLQQYNLPIDGSADTADPDGDGLNNWQEWRCGTDPLNARSVLRLLAPVTAGTNVTVSWQSVAGVNYFLDRSGNLTVPTDFTSRATNILGQPGTTTFVDTNTVGAGPLFYRVGVGN